MKAFLILVFAVAFLSGCSHSILVKECQPVEETRQFVCKTVLPWQ